MIHGYNFFRSCDLFFLYFSLSRNFYLAPIGLPCFKCGLNSFFTVLMDCPIGTSILTGVLVAEMWDFTIFLLFVNSSSNWFAILCQWIILWTSSSYWFVRGSRWDKIKEFQVISRCASSNNFSPPMSGWLFHQMTIIKIYLKNITNKGLKYLIIDGELKPNVLVRYGECNGNIYSTTKCFSLGCWPQTNCIRECLW